MEYASLYLGFLFLWVIVILQAIHFRQLGRLSKRQSMKPLRGDVPACSVVITCHNHAEQLRQSLPILLEQEYPSEYEIIVVDMLSTDDTKDVLESFEYSYPHLHHTHCPETARDISLQRLALTLGVRAAAHEWVVFTSADCHTSERQWLFHLMQPCDEKRDAVLGLMRYEEDGSLYGRRWQFFHLWQQMLWLPYSRRFAPYRADGACLCYRRSHFMAHQGFASSALLESGAETLLVNRHIARGRCDINVRPQALVCQELPPRHRWAEERLFFMATRRQMRQGFLYRMWYACHLLAQLLFPLSALVLVALTWPNPYVAAAVAILWLIAILVRQRMFLSTTRQLGIRPFRLSLPLFLHMPLFWDTSAWLRWLASDKKIYRKKFV